MDAQHDPRTSVAGQVVVSLSDSSFPSVRSMDEGSTSPDVTNLQRCTHITSDSIWPELLINLKSKTCSKPKML